MNEADNHLLDLIRAADHDGWNQFVARFQKRLLAFALRQVDQEATAEDLVQETFIAFLQALPEYREECELESFLFQILRRRIVDHYRRQGRNRELPACTFQSPSAAAAVDDPLQRAASREMHASWYARREEARDRDHQALSCAVRKLATKLQSAEKLRDLKIAEGLFYARLRNRQLADVLGISENDVALVKHRLIGRLAQSVREGGASPDEQSLVDGTFSSLLTSVWESHRPSCPKRTTLGKYILRILPLDWDDFVSFHVDILGCTFCNANLAELQAPAEASESSTVHERLFTSTVGFLRMPSH